MKTRRVLHICEAQPNYGKAIFMNEEILQQIFAEIFSELEPLDTQTSALLQFLKSKGIATDEELAPFLDQAANASSVRSVALRARIDALLSSALKPSNSETDTWGEDKEEPRSGAQGKARNKTRNENENEDQRQQSAPEQSPSSPGPNMPKSAQSAPHDKYSNDDLRDSKLSDPPLLPDVMGHGTSQSSPKTQDPASSEQRTSNESKAQSRTEAA